MTLPRPAPDPRHDACDVLVVGAGPAGLTAAIYLARYRRKVLVAHDGESCAARIPLTRNVPGFPGGIAGAELVGRMVEQAKLYGAAMVEDRIDTLVESKEGYVAHGRRGTYRARAVILATGVRLNEAELPRGLHEAALAWHCLRYCPVCDGFEARGKAVGVMGSTRHGAREALFLRELASAVTLLPRAGCELDDEARRALAAAGVEVIDTPVASLQPSETGMQVRLADGAGLRFDILYPALGVEPRSELAARLGARLDADGCVVTGAHQELEPPLLFAAGDVVAGLNQISVAIGQGAVAATAAHNALRERDGLTL